MSAKHSCLMLVLTALLLVGACSVERTPTEHKAAATSASAIAVEKPLPDRPKLEAKGQNEPFVVGTGARNTLLELAPPQLWYELNGADGEIVKVELSKEDSAGLDEHWRKLAKYHAAKRYFSDGDEKAQSAYDHSISFGNVLNRLRQTTVKILEEETELTENEVHELLSLQTTVFRLRLEEVLNAFPEAK